MLNAIYVPAAFAALVVATAIVKPRFIPRVISEHVSRWGFSRAAYALFMIQLQRRLHINFFYLTARPLTKNTNVRSRSLHREFRALEREELLRYAADPGLDMSVDFVRAASDRGDICIGAIEKGRLVGYSWVAFQSAPHLDGLWVSFPSHLRYTYKVFVRPSSRGTRVAGEISQFADGICVDRGKSEGIEIIDSYNFASLRAFHRVGARTVGYAGYVCWFGKAFLFYSPGAKKYGFRFTRRA